MHCEPSDSVLGRAASLCVDEWGIGIIERSPPAETFVPDFAKLISSFFVTTRTLPETKHDE
jgi:hypothetical protein